MLGLDLRALRAAWTVFLFALLIGLVYRVRHTLIVFALAIFLAHLLAPLVERLQRFVPRRMSRTLALAIVYLAFVGVALAILIPLGGKIGEQAAALAGQLPETLKSDPLSHIPLPSALEPWRPRISEILKEQAARLGQGAVPMLREIGPGILSGIGTAVAVVLVPILSFFFLKDGPALRAALLESVRAGRRSVVEETLNDLHVLVAQYIRALVLLAMAAFACYSAFLSLAQVPYPVLLAGIAGVLEAIPVLGPAVGGIVMLVVAALSGYQHVLWILIFLIVYRLFQDYVLSPYLLGSGIELHPLLVLFGLLAGEQVAGIPGMFFSVPVIAALRIIVVRFRREHTRA